MDFSKFKDGDKIYAVNLLEHQDGKTPNQAIPLSTVLSGAYSAGGCPASCDPLVGTFMRLSLQLWDMQTGELLWASMAEASLESEAVGQDPIYFEDTARVTMGSMLEDFINGQVTSSYGPLNGLIDQLIQIPEPEQGR